MQAMLQVILMQHLTLPNYYLLHSRVARFISIPRANIFGGKLEPGRCHTISVVEI